MRTKAEIIASNSQRRLGEAKPSMARRAKPGTRVCPFRLRRPRTLPQTPMQELPQSGFSKMELLVTARKLFWVILIVAAGSAACAFAQSNPSYPEIVQTEIEEARKDCAAAVFKAGFVTERDVNGDGRKDYILDYRNLQCEEVGSLYCGSAGCLTQVFVSLPDGTYEKVLNENPHLNFV
jgi:hypothetical protein